MKLIFTRTFAYSTFIADGDNLAYGSSVYYNLSPDVKDAGLAVDGIRSSNDLGDDGDNGDYDGSPVHSCSQSATGADPTLIVPLSTASDVVVRRVVLVARGDNSR